MKHKNNLLASMSVEIDRIKSQKDREVELKKIKLSKASLVADRLGMPHLKDMLSESNSDFIDAILEIPGKKNETTH